MGGQKSKLLTELKGSRAAEMEARGKLNDCEHDCKGLAASLEEQKSKFAEKYQELQNNYAELQERFLRLKSKLELDDLSSGDFGHRVESLNRKLNDALSERDFVKIEAEKQIEALLANHTNPEVDIHDSVRSKLLGIESAYLERIQCLELEQSIQGENSAEKANEIQKLRAEQMELKKQFEAEKRKLEEDYNRQGQLFCTQYNNEKEILNRQWEMKLGEVMRNCNDEVLKFKASLVQENSALQDKLSTAMKDIDSLSRKYKLLNNLFEEIRTRYERRESRKEDLERIADLEGQLIIQSEEMERQKDILKSLKIATPTTNGSNRRNRRNARKHQNKRGGTNNTTTNGNGPNENIEISVHSPKQKV